MKLLCLPLLRRPWNIVVSQPLQLSTHSNCTTVVPLAPLSRRASLAQYNTNLAPSIPFYRRSSFWITLLSGLAVISALIFFLIQWLYQDWTAQKDFLEHCQSLQDANKPLSPSCDRALKTPLPPPPFSHSNYVRRYIVDKTPLQIFLFYEKISTLQQFLVISLCFNSVFIISILALIFICSTSFRIFGPGGWPAKLASHSRGAKDWDEECSLENNAVETAAPYTTTLEAPHRSGLHHRNPTTNDLDIAALLAPTPTPRQSSIWSKRGDTGRRRKLRRTLKKLHYDVPNSSIQMPQPSASLDLPSALRLPSTLSFWFESLGDKLRVVLPAWPKAVIANTEAPNNAPAQGNVSPVPSLPNDPVVGLLDDPMVSLFDGYVADLFDDYVAGFFDGREWSI